MKSPSAGFTLLEVMVALVVLGLLLVTLTQGVHFGSLASRAEARLEATNGDLNEIDVMLRRVIGAMDPGAEDDDFPPLRSGPNSMTFVTDLPITGGSSPAQHVEAALLVDQRHWLVLRWRPLAVTDRTDRPPPWHETQLLPDVSSMQLMFWRRSGGWADSWQFSNLPVMIRIRLTFVDPAARHWPDIVVAPRLDRR